jgi:hypothetical protein
VDDSDERPHLLYDLHTQYVALVERQMECFCRDNDTEPSVIFNEISEQINDNVGIAEFVPVVLSNCEYSRFEAQMKAAADLQGVKRRAEVLAKRSLNGGSGGGSTGKTNSVPARSSSRAQTFNLSGVYRADPTDNGFVSKDWDQYLTSTKLPWVFRKLYLKTAKTIRDVIIHHDEDGLRFRFKMKFIGTTDMYYPTDGRSYNLENQWNKPCVQVSYADHDTETVVVIVDPHPAMEAGGKTTHKFSTEVGRDGKKRFVWQQHLVDPANDVEIECLMRFLKDEGDDDGGGEGDENDSGTGGHK